MTTKLRLITLGLLLLNLFLFSSSVAHGQEAGDEGLPKLDIVVILDESNSMWQGTDIWPNDDSPERLKAFELLIDMLAADRATGDDVRVSVIAFGTKENSRIILPFTAANAGTVEDIKTVYREFLDKTANPPEGQPVSLGWTDALYALELAEQALTEPGRGHLPDHKPAVIILSDGKPETPEINEDKSSPDEIRAYLDRMYDQAARLSSSPGGPFDYQGVCKPLKQGWVPIYTIAIRVFYTLPEVYQDIWRRLAEQNGGNYYANPEGLTLFDKPGAEGLGHIYYKIWQELRCRPRQLTPVNSPITLPFTVTNLYRQIMFTILKDTPDVQVTIKRPDGTSLTPTNNPKVILNKSLLDEIWTISRSEPWTGPWTVELTNPGRVLFAYESFPDDFKVEQLSPTRNFVQAGMPIKLALRIKNGAGETITANIQSFKVTVESPDGAVTSFDNVKPEGDIFGLSYETKTEGKYKISGLFQISDKGLTGGDEGFTFEWPWNGDIIATLDTYLAAVSPAPNSSYHTTMPIPLAVDVKVGQKLAEGAATQKNLGVTATIYQEKQRVAGPYSLTYNGQVGPARLQAEIPAGTLREGAYQVEFSLPPFQKYQEPVITTVAFSIKSAPAAVTPPPTATSTPLPPTPTPTPLPPAPTPEPTLTPTPSPVTEPPSGGMIAAILAGLALLAIGGGLAWWYWQLPALLPLTLIDQSDGTSVFIRGKVGGKFAETHSFLTSGGEKVRLNFSPAQDDEGLRATRLTLLTDLDTDTGTLVEVDSLGLSFKGDTALITGESSRLVIGDKEYTISTY